MTQLTNEVKMMFEQQLAFIGTASVNGTPNVAPKGSMHVYDDETLVYAEGRGGKTLRNLMENPNVAVSVVDREKVDGYQVKGKAQLFTEGELFEKIASRQELRKRRRPQYVVKINVEEIYSLKPRT